MFGIYDCIYGCISHGLEIHLLLNSPREIMNMCFKILNFQGVFEMLRRDRQLFMMSRMYFFLTPYWICINTLSSLFLCVCFIWNTYWFLRNYLPIKWHSHVGFNERLTPWTLFLQLMWMFVRPPLDHQHATNAHTNRVSCKGCLVFL